MDIELPNGVVVQDVPEGMTKSQIMAQAIRNGLATPEDFGFKSQPTEQSQPAQQPSMTQELGRQVGLFGRAAYEGLTAPATTVLEGLRSAYNLGANIVGSESRLPSVAQAQSQMLTKAGLPEPQNMAERAVQTGTQAMMGTGTLAAMAPKVPALAGNLVLTLNINHHSVFTAHTIIVFFSLSVTTNPFTRTTSHISNHSTNRTNTQTNQRSVFRSSTRAHTSLNQN